MIKTMRTIVISMTILLMAVTAMAQSPPSGKWWRNPRVVNALNLTGDEIQRLEQAYEMSRRRMIDLKNKVEREQFELSNMLEKRNMDEAAVRAQNRRLEQARSELADAKFAFVIDVRRIIGAQRFQQLLDLKP